MRLNKPIFSLIFALAITSLAQIKANPLLADERSALTGEIEMEQADKKVDSYSVTEALAISEFEKLQVFTKVPDLSTFASTADLGESLLVHLNAFYLYCSINRGICPHVLDAILEIDLINSRKNKTIACPNMHSFWKLWLNNDMEKRQQYQVKTGYIQQTTEFKNKTRPTYLKCQTTLTTMANLEVTDDQAYFTERYKEGSSITRSIENLVKDLQQAKASKVNFLYASGSKK